MTPGKAASKAVNIIKRRLNGASSQRKAHVRRIQKMMKWIFHEHGAVAGTTLKAKHVRSYFMRGPVSRMTIKTRYEHWLSCRKLLQAIDKFDDWYPHLSGPWIRPTGKSGKLQTGRPEKKITNKTK